MLGPVEDLKGLKRRLLEAVWSQHLSDEAIAEAEEVYPELAWLAECLQRAPLPIEWFRQALGDSSADGGSICYLNPTTGDVLDEPPFFDIFVELAHLTATSMQDVESEEAIQCASQVRDIQEEALSEARRIRKRWSKHFAPELGMAYYFDTETGTSTWRIPASAQLYLAWVADQLLGLEGVFKEAAAHLDDRPGAGATMSCDFSGAGEGCGPILEGESETPLDAEEEPSLGETPQDCLGAAGAGGTGGGPDSPQLPGCPCEE